MKRILWVTPWTRKCGIADYSQEVYPKIKKIMGAREQFIELWELQLGTAGLRSLLQVIKDQKIDQVHFQHEYGLFGGKNPPLYQFPKWIKVLRGKCSGLQISSTAHTVLAPDFRYAVKGKGWQAPIRWVLNETLLSKLNQIWRQETWGAQDAVVVHSARQVEWVQRSGQNAVSVIPHFVPEVSLAPPGSIARPMDTDKKEALIKRIVVFGFFSPEKGQDLMIEALAQLPESVHLTLAGGVRRHQDRGYYDECRDRVDRLGLKSRVEWTGFVPKGQIDRIYARAHLVVAPFRETTGSGSLAHALARGMPILTADLPLNTEIVERVPGCLAFFEREDAADLAWSIQKLFETPDQLQSLRSYARVYADRYSSHKIAEAYADYFATGEGFRA